MLLSQLFALYNNYAVTLVSFDFQKYKYSYHDIDLQIPYGDKEEGLFLTTLACKDPNTPTPRILGILAGAFVGGFVGASIVSSASSNRYRRRGWVKIIWTDNLFYKATVNPQTIEKW